MKRKTSTVRGRTKVGNIVRAPLASAGASKGDEKTLTFATVEVTLLSKELPSLKLSYRPLQMENC